MTLPVRYSALIATFALALAVATPGVSETAAAILTEWGTDVLTSSRQGSNVSFGPVVGGGKQSSFASSEVDALGGTARGQASLPAGNVLTIPVLRGAAESSSGPAQSTSTAIEGYTHTGSTDKTFTLTSTLTANVVPGSLSGSFPTHAEARVYLFEEQPFQFLTDLPTLIFEVGAKEIDSFELLIDDGNKALSGSLNFTLTPGQSVYLFTQLFAQGSGGGSADAFGTLTSEFDDSTGLVAASQGPLVPTAVPEPTALLVWLILGVVLSTGKCLPLRKRRAD